MYINLSFSVLSLTRKNNCLLESTKKKLIVLTTIFLSVENCLKHHQRLGRYKIRALQPNGRKLNSLKTSQDLNLLIKQPKTIQEPMLSFPEIETSISSEVSEILTLLLYTVGLAATPLRGMCKFFLGAVSLCKAEPYRFSGQRDPVIRIKCYKVR